jgi:hypothetical protein
LIKNGQLTAMNIALNPNGLPRFKVLIEELKRFEQARASKRTA